MFRRKIILIGTLLLTLVSATLPVVVSAVEYDTDIETVIVHEDGTVTEIHNDDPYQRTMLISENNGEEHYITIDYRNNQLYIDGIEVHTEVTIEEESPNIIMPFATVDYSTGITYSQKIPWKGSVILLSAAIGGLIGGADGAAWAATIAGALTADAENLWVRYTQYKSKERYYSNYNGVYYNKVRNMSINFYKSSISSSNRILGPVNGSWFDPIRP